MITYKPFETNYLDQVLVLLEPLWGYLSLEERKVYFKWKYIQNPNIKNTTAYIALDEELNKVIAFRGYFALKFTLNNKELLFNVFSDAVVHMDYRRKGVFKKLTEFSLNKLSSVKQNRVIYSISSNSYANNSHLNQKSVKLTTKKTLYKFKYLNYKTKLNIEYSKKCDYNEIKFLYKSLINKNKFYFSYDAEQLLWRYNNPITHYNFIYVRKNDAKLSCYLSYYKIDSTRVHVIDYIYEDVNDFKAALSYLEKKEKNLLTQIEVFSSEEDIFFKQLLGFKPFNLLKKIFKKPIVNDILVRPLPFEFTLENWKIDDIDIREIKNWHLTLICSDGI